MSSILNKMQTNNKPLVERYGTEKQTFPPCDQVTLFSWPMASSILVRKYFCKTGQPTCLRKKREHERGPTKDNLAAEGFSMRGQFALFLAPVLPYADSCHLPNLLLQSGPSFDTYLPSFILLPDSLIIIKIQSNE